MMREMALSSKVRLLSLIGAYSLQSANRSFPHCQAVYWHPRHRAFTFNVHACEPFSYELIFFIFPRTSVSSYVLKFCRSVTLTRVPRIRIILSDPSRVNSRILWRPPWFLHTGFIPVTINRRSPYLLALVALSYVQIFLLRLFSPRKDKICRYEIQGWYQRVSFKEDLRIFKSPSTSTVAAESDALMFIGNGTMIQDLSCQFWFSYTFLACFLLFVKSNYINININKNINK